MLKSFLIQKYNLSKKQVEDILLQYIDDIELNDVSLCDIIDMFNNEKYNITFDLIFDYSYNEGYSSNSRHCSSYNLSIYKSNENIIVFSYDNEVDTGSADLYLYNIRYNYDDNYSRHNYDDRSFYNSYKHFFSKCFNVYPLTKDGIEEMENKYIYNNHNIIGKYHEVVKYFYNLYGKNVDEYLNKYITHINNFYYFELEKIKNNIH